MIVTSENKLHAKELPEAVEKADAKNIGISSVGSLPLSPPRTRVS
jgi:hypothetical protein